MAGPQQKTPICNRYRACCSLLLAFLACFGGERIFAQAVDTNNVTSPATQTNSITAEQEQSSSEVTSTNQPIAAPSLLENYTAPVPQPYAEVPSATIGTGRLASPVYGTSALTGPSPNAPPPARLRGIWQSGDVALHAILGETMLYGNGLEFTPGSQTSTFVSEFSPSIFLNAGRNWTFNYAPTIIDYSSDKFQDSVSQSESITGSAFYNDWRFGVAQSYASATQPLVETGQETSTEVIVGSIWAGRQLGDQFSFNLNAGWNYRDAKSFDTVGTWSGGATLLYAPAQQLSFNLSLSGGYDLINVGSDIVFESVQAGMTFHPGSKLTLRFSGGAQEMQFVDPSAPPFISPIFDASLTYNATKSTVVGVEGQESATPSFFANQVITETSVSAFIQQQLSRKLSLGLTGSYSSEPYTSIEIAPLPQFYLGLRPVSVLETVRSDTTESLNIRLGYNLSDRITGSIFYTLSQNSSGQANYKYTSIQEGLSLSYVF